MKKLNTTLAILSLLITPHIWADTTNQTQTIKYLMSIDYPAGINGKQLYLKWVKNNVGTFKSYPEVKSIASYDNYYGTNPHRLVEFNFSDMQSATKYWSRPKIYKILQNLPNHSSVAKIDVFIKRGEYNK